MIAVKRVCLLLSVALVSCFPSLNRAPLEVFVERKPDLVRDQGAHRAPLEWWYLNGHLDTPSGKRGFAGAIFQAFIPDDAPFGLAAQYPDAFYFGHYSIVNKQTGEYQSAERSTRVGTRANVRVAEGSAAKDRLDVRLGDWRIQRLNQNEFQAVFSLNGREKIDLTMRLTRPEVIHGPGWSGTPEIGRMYYFGATRLEVRGLYNGQAVTGSAWLDRQWGGGDGDGSASFAPRWNWFGLQLEDGRDVMVYQLRNAKEVTADLFASIVYPDGRVVEDRKVTVQPWDWWTSATNRRYPVRWHIRLGDGTVLNIKPVTNAQEVESRATANFNYYEGAVDVSGTVRGQGYMELTGYPPNR